MARVARPSEACPERQCRSVATRANGHLYYLLLPTLADRTAFIDRLKSLDIQAVFHYVPLHSSPFGKVVARASGDLSITDDVSDRLVRLPLWLGLEDHLDEVIAAVIQAVIAGASVTSAPPAL